MKKLTRLQERYKVELVDKLIKWIKEQLKDKKAIIGISGGKDSTICAALCAEAIGKENVYGILMPNGGQVDIDDSYKVVDHLGINKFVVNINEFYNPMISKLRGLLLDIKDVVSTNIPPRLRMTVLYAFAASLQGRVICTSNASEAYIGWTTKWGDNTGDIAPLLNFTKTEVNAIGSVLDIPEELVFKTPADGLCGKSDEEKLGFTYEQLDRYITDNDITDNDNEPSIAKIKERHIGSKHKREPIPSFLPDRITYEDIVFREDFFKENN